MRRWGLVLFAVLATVVVPVVPAQAHAPWGAYCPVTGIDGTGDWTEPVTALLSSGTMFISVDVSCISIFDTTLDHHFLFSGPSIQSCEVGEGSGTIVGTTPDGSINYGTYLFFNMGFHYFVYGEYEVGDDETGHPHRLYLWLDALALCNYEHSDIVGHGWVADGL